MARSIFRQPFMGDPKARVSFKVKPITLAVYSYDIPPEKLGEVLKRAVPKGYVGTSPQVIKTLDGEFLLYSDSTVQFVPLGRNAGERVPI
jgi:hypothetical protein